MKIKLPDNQALTIMTRHYYKPYHNTLAFNSLELNF